MRKVSEVREQLVDHSKMLGMMLTTTDDLEIIQRTVATAFYYQAARRKGIGEYVTLRSGVVCGLHLTSSVFGSGLSPEYVVYHELVYTRKEFIRCVTSMEPHWLVDAGPLLYKLRYASDVDLQRGLLRRTR